MRISLKKNGNFVIEVTGNRLPSRRRNSIYRYFREKYGEKWKIKEFQNNPKVDILPSESFFPRKKGKAL